MASSDKIDWMELGNPLPIAQNPREQALRKEIFDRIDNNHNGYLTMTEAIDGLASCLESSRAPRKSGGGHGHYMVPLENLRPAATAAFKMARGVAPATSRSSKARAKDLCVDRREFHACLVAFKMYVELDVLYSKMDHSGDRQLNWKELEPHVGKLESWHITKKAAKSRFKDDWTPCMSYNDFADWAITVAFRDNPDFLKLDENDPEETLRDAVTKGQDRDDEAKMTRSVLEAFKEWDTDGNESISKEELTKVFMALDETFTEEMAEQLYELADVNKDGRIDYVEFSNWVTGKEFEIKTTSDPVKEVESKEKGEETKEKGEES